MRLLRRKIIRNEKVIEIYRDPFPSSADLAITRRTSQRTGSCYQEFIRHRHRLQKLMRPRVSGGAAVNECFD